MITLQYLFTAAVYVWPSDGTAFGRCTKPIFLPSNTARFGPRVLSLFAKHVTMIKHNNLSPLAITTCSKLKLLLARRYYKQLQRWLSYLDDQPRLFRFRYPQFIINRLSHRELPVQEGYLQRQAPGGGTPRARARARDENRGKTHRSSSDLSCSGLPANPRRRLTPELFETSSLQPSRHKQCLQTANGASTLA